jgi:hypothetical protein
MGLINNDRPSMGYKGVVVWILSKGPGPNNKTETFPVPAYKLYVNLKLKLKFYVSYS